MIRYSDWALRLDVYLRAQAHRQFQYGDFDCCLFVCEAIEAMTGVDPALAVRGKYETRGQAKRAIWLAYGSRSIRAVIIQVAAEHGMRQLEPQFARRGDVVLLRHTTAIHSLGILSLNGREVLTPGDDGLVAVPRSIAVEAWLI